MRMTGADAESCDSYTTPVLSQIVGTSGDDRDGRKCARRLRSGQRGAALGIAGPRRRADDHGAHGRGRFRLRDDRACGVRSRRSNSAATAGSTRLSAVAWKYTDSTPDTCCPVVAGGFGLHRFRQRHRHVSRCPHGDSASGGIAFRSRNFKVVAVWPPTGMSIFSAIDGQCTVVDASGEFRDRRDRTRSTTNSRLLRPSPTAESTSAAARRSTRLENSVGSLWKNTASG